MEQQQRIDSSQIVLDDAGRFEIDPAHLVDVVGGAKIEVIRGTKCTKEGDNGGKIIRGTKCTNK